MNAPPGKRGFTLVEVVVALSILSLVLLATVTGLRTLGNTQAAIERKTSRVDEVRAVSGFLRDLMESAIVGARSGGLSLGGGVREETYFEASGDSMAWKSTILFGEAFGGSHYVRVANEEGQLMLRWLDSDLPRIDPQDWQEAPSRVLVRDLESFAVAYRHEFDQEWVGDWEGGPIPALVRLQIKSAGKYWPDLILRVQR